MKERFLSDLTGKKWWAPFLTMIVIMVASIGAYEFALFRLDSSTDPAFAAVSVLFALVMLLIFVLTEAGFGIILMKIAVPTVSYKDRRFGFDGDPWAYIRLVLKGIGLTLITLGFYGPWFARRCFAYVTAHVEYDGERPKFLGTGGKLLKYTLLSLIVPLILLLVVFSAAVGLKAASGASGPEFTAWLMASTLLFELVLFFALLPYIYLAYRWYVNLSWKGRLITWNTEFWASVFFLAGQLALTIITLGIYWPALVIKSYRYFAARTQVAEDGKVFARFSFDGSVGKGFLLLWGQTLLSIITIGIYVPWAYASVLRYFINGTACEKE